MNFELDLDDGIFIEREEEIAQLIVKAKTAPNTREKRQAELRLLKNLNAPKFMEWIIDLMVRPTVTSDVRSAAVSFVKNHKEELLGSQRSVILIELLLSHYLSGTNPKINDELKSIFVDFTQENFQFDQLMQVYEQKMEEVSIQLADLSLLDPFVTIYYEIKNASNQILTPSVKQFLQILLIGLAKMGTAFAKKVMKMPPQLLIKKQRKIFARVNRLFEFIQNELDIVSDNEPAQMSAMANEKQLMELFRIYLVLFSDKGTMISHVPPCFPNQSPQAKPYKCCSESCNITFNLKFKILSVIALACKHMDDREHCPPEITTIMIQTLESLPYTPQVFNFGQTNVLVSYCLIVIEKNIAYYLKKCSDRKKQVQAISAMLLHLTTTEKEWIKLGSDPESYIRQTNQCFLQKIEYYQNSVRAKIATIFRSIFEKQIIEHRLLLDFLALIQDTARQSSLKAVKFNQGDEQYDISEYHNFAFYRLSRDEKLEALLFALTVLSQSVLNYTGFLQIVRNVLANNFEFLITVQQLTTVLRLMRAASHYYQSKYVPYLMVQMKRGKIFLLQGLMDLAKMSKGRESYYFLQFLCHHYEQVINLMTFDQKIFKKVVQSMQQFNNLQAYDLLCTKFRQLFFSKDQDYQKFKALTLEALPKLFRHNAKNNDIFIHLLNMLEQIYAFDQNNQKTLHRRCSQFDKIFSQILRYCDVSSQYTQSLFKRIIDNINRKHRQQHNKVELFNLYFAKIRCNFEELFEYFSFCQEEIIRRVEEHKLRQKITEGWMKVVTCYSFLMSQIIFIRPDVCLKDESLMRLFYLAKLIPQPHQQSIIAIIFSFAYVQLDEFLTFLRRNQICLSYLKKVLRVPIKQPFFIKIFNMVFTKLIETHNENFFDTKTFERCVYYLQKQINNKDRRVYDKLIVLHENEKDEVTLCHYTKLIHPLSACNQLQEFKQAYRLRKNHIQVKLDKKEAEILEYILSHETKNSTKRADRWGGEYKL